MNIYFDLRTGEKHYFLTDKITEGGLEKNKILLKNECGKYILVSTEEFTKNFKDETNCPIEFIAIEKLRRRDYVLTIEEAIRQIKNNIFDDCDGYVFYSTDKYHTFIEVDYNDLMEGNYRPEFTHVYISGK